MNAKYELTDETKNGLFRIRAKVAFGNVAAGELGGFIASECNLSAYGNAWVYGDARVYSNAWVYGDAQVSGNVWVYGNARVYRNAWVSGDAQVSGNARVYGDAWVYGNARVYGSAWVYGDAQLSGNAWVSGNARVSGNASFLLIGPIGSRRAFLSIYADAKIKVRYTTGCFSGSRAELLAAVKKTHKAGTLYRKQYDAALAMAKLVKPS
jgi:carbonic anhydrase/acetyltransferase-like protein (isoleucine patch superfamily)